MIHEKDIDKVRKDIKDYESHKRVKHLSTLGIVGSTVAAGIGAYRGDKRILATGLGGGFVSGFTKGRAKREEQAALNRIKNFYDLRKMHEKSPDGMKKVAVIGGAIEALSGIAAWAMGTDAHSMVDGARLLAESVVSPSTAAALAPVLPSLIDIGTIPWAANKASQSLRDHAYVGAKHEMGLPMTNDEVSKYLFSRGLKNSADSIPVIEETLRRSASGSDSLVTKTKTKAQYYPKKLWRGLVKTYSGPWGQGGELGAQAGKALKEINKVSPRYANLALDAIKDTQGVDNLKAVLTKDLGTFQTAGNILDSTIDEVPYLRQAIRATGKSSTGLAKSIIENPDKAINIANDVKAVVKKTVRGGKYMGAAAGLSLLGMGLGKYRKRHALATNTLPKILTEDQNQKKA